MALPNPSMVFTPFDQLPASDLNKIVSNVEALAAGTGLNDGVVTNDKIGLTTYTDANGWLVFNYGGYNIWRKTVTNAGLAAFGVIGGSNWSQAVAILSLPVGVTNWSKLGQNCHVDRLNATGSDYLYLLNVGIAIEAGGTGTKPVIAKNPTASTITNTNLNIAVHIEVWLK